MRKKIHLKDLIKIYSEFSNYENKELRKKELLYATKKFTEVVQGSSKDEYVKDYVNRHNYYSQDTYSFMSNNPWSVMNEHNSNYFEDYSDTYKTNMKSINVDEIYA